jgi:hypothetical protein
MAKAAQDHERSFSAGVNRGAEAVAEWLEGAQWDDAGQPCRSDAFTVIDAHAARKLARMVRDRFADGADPPGMPTQLEKMPPEKCVACEGKEQVWGVTWETDDEDGWMGWSAFVLWTGTETAARNLAVKKNEDSRDGTVYTAVQRKCPRCGKTNRRERNR